MRAAAFQCLVFFNVDGVVFTDFDAGFTAEAFFGMGRAGFAVGHFVHFNGTDVHAFATATHLSASTVTFQDIVTSSKFWIKRS